MCDIDLTRGRNFKKMNCYNMIFKLQKVDKETKNNFKYYNCLVLFPYSITCLFFFGKTVQSLITVQDFECDESLDLIFWICVYVFSVNTVINMLNRVSTQCKQILKIYHLLCTFTLFPFYCWVLYKIMETENCSRDFYENMQIYVMVVLIGNIVQIIVYVLECITICVSYENKCLTLIDLY